MSLVAFELANPTSVVPPKHLTVSVGNYGCQVHQVLLSMVCFMSIMAIFSTMPVERKRVQLQNRVADFQLLCYSHISWESVHM